MKRTLTVLLALAFAGGMLTGCDRPSGAGAGGTSATPGGSSSSGSAGSGSSTDQTKRSPSGAAGGSSSTGK